jgi:aspartyl-tRNA(Asn)/glutamyl-tRNA(Gln) amidotransferase subunit A
MRTEHAGLSHLTIKQASDLIERREISVTDLVRSVIKRIRETQQILRAYVTLMQEEALAAASRADAELARGSSRGLLHGIPVALKDLYDVAGIPTKSGSRVRESYIANEDAEVTARLRAAGAIVVGKTVTHEFALGFISPPARCAWDSGRIPGGSSGGSGAAVAANAALAAMGTDTGSSVRNPACINGVVGLKPTYGRVSKRGIMPLSWSCDHAGPITKTVEDCAIVLSVIAGRDVGDPTSADMDVPDFTSKLGASLRGLRMGVPRNYFFDLINPDVEKAVRDAITLLEGEGAQLIDVSIPNVEHSLSVVNMIALVEASAIHRREMQDKIELYGDEVRLLLELGRLLPGTIYVDAQRVRSLIKRSLKDVFESARLDLLVTPTCPTTALPVGEEMVSIAGEPRQHVMNHYPRYTCAFNLSGQPALTVPCGFDKLGLPIGLQIIGRPFDEITVLQAGHAYESVTEWHFRHPLI